MPYPRSARWTPVRGVPVIVGDRRAMGIARAPAPTFRKHRRSRWPPRKALPASGSRCNLLRRTGRHRMAAATGGVPTGEHRVGDLRPLGPGGGVAAHPRRPAGPHPRPRRTPPAAVGGDHRLPIGAGSRHRGPVESWIRRRQEDQRPQTSHRGRHQRTVARGGGDHGRDRRTATVRCDC